MESNRLDRTGIHPENYDEVKKLLASLGFTTDDLGYRRVKKGT